jgi:hypothetical protein
LDILLLKIQIFSPFVPLPLLKFKQTEWNSKECTLNLMRLWMKSVMKLRQWHSSTRIFRAFYTTQSCKLFVIAHFLISLVLTFFYCWYKCILTSDQCGLMLIYAWKLLL